MDNISLEHTAPPLPQRALSELCRLLRLACRWALPLLLALAEGGRAATSLDSLSNRTSVAPPGSLDYVILDSETTSGHSNIQAQASFTMDNPTGAAVRTNVLQFRVINAATGNPHPIYDFGNTTTNLNYTYNITNRLSFLGATPQTLSTNAFIRPAAWMDQFTPFYIECTMFTNGIVVNQRATPPANYYHFTNTVSGDDAYNVRLNFTNAAWSRTYAVQTILGQNTFQVSAGYEVRRWDDFNAAVSAVSIPIVFNYTLRDAGGNTVPLVTSSQTFHDSVTNYLLDVLQYPTFQTGQHTLDIQPAAQLDSGTKTYYLTVTLAHINNPVSGQVLTANTQQTVALELLHFNGNLSFGAINTTMTSLGGSPPTNAPSGSIIQTTLPSVGGLVTANQAGIFTAANLVVNLDSLGNPVVTTGSANLLSANDSLAQVNFQRSHRFSGARARVSPLRSAGENQPGDRTANHPGVLRPGAPHRLPGPHVEVRTRFRHACRRGRHAGESTGRRQDLPPPHGRIRRRLWRRPRRKLVRQPSVAGQSLRLRTTGMESRSQRAAHRRRVDQTHLRQRPKNRGDDQLHPAHLLAHVRKLHRPARPADPHRYRRQPLRRERRSFRRQRVGPVAQCRRKGRRHGTHRGQGHGAFHA